MLPVRLEQAISRSRVKHSTTEPPLSSFTNSVDPDEMQQYAAFHLGFHCLQKCSFRGYSNTNGFNQGNNSRNIFPRILSKHDINNHLLRTQHLPVE